LTAIFALSAIIAIVPLAIALCAYVAYPAVLWVIAYSRRSPEFEPQVLEWPFVTVTVPVYNAAASIRETLEHLLDLDYPRDKLQLLVISDASDDGTDDIVRSYAGRGVELLRLSQRRGKTVAENAAAEIARGDIVVNVDSTILVPSASLKKLVRVFENPEIGVASGRDVSKGQAEQRGTHAESGYVGYEMWIRDLETQVGSIVGASGCFYASRRSIHAKALPPGLSWDFASALNARTQGYRSVSVRDATCIVPRAAEVRTEMTRKVRTMARGLRTLFYYRELMNPLSYGSFAVMLICHKLLRWLPYLFAPFAYVALCALAMHSVVPALILGAVSLGLAAGVAGIRWKKAGLPRVIALSGFVVAVFCAGFLAWITALRQTPLATWEPTPRPQVRVDANQDHREAQLSV
jgi:cellulose synthase/poly-beta-1,6-N-acetylglucosamine synthase-like glycosyltransferase